MAGNIVLIVPSGIETRYIVPYETLKQVLIVPSGIETGISVPTVRGSSKVLIVPSGIETMEQI